MTFEQQQQAANMRKQQEQQILAQAKGGLTGLLPRREICRDALNRIQDGLTQYDADTQGGDHLVPSATALSTLLHTILDVQRIQLEGALKEAETEIKNLNTVIAQIESPIKSPIFMPPGA